MNHTNFKKWVVEKLLPNLYEPSLVVMDNASYHNTCINKAPTTNNNKGAIIDWLKENNVEYNEHLTKPQLLEIVKRHKPEPVYAVDVLLREKGHKVILYNFFL